MMPMAESENRDHIRLGPPRVYRPICICTPLGFIGGPSGYLEARPDQQDVGPVVVDATGFQQRRAAEPRVS